MVARYTGIAVQANKAIVGKNAFAHESGIHQHGVLKHANTYEIITPESVGATGDLVLGKHSGKAAYKARLIEMGYEDVANDEAALRRLVDGAKAVADKKKTLSDEDLETLLGETLYVGHEDTWELVSLNVQTDSKDSGNLVTATATVKLKDVTSGDESMEAAIGVGPVDATFKAISRMVKRPASLTHYNITKIHGGTVGTGNDSLASVVLRIQGEEEAPVLPHDFPGHQGATFRRNGNVTATFRESQLSDDFVKSKVGSTPTYNGNGTSTDVIVASARAYLDAMNRMIDSQDKKQRPS